MITASDEVVRHSLAYLSVPKWLAGGRSLLRENLTETDQACSKNTDFRLIFARSTSAVMKAKKSSIVTAHYKLSNEPKVNCIGG